MVLNIFSYVDIFIEENINLSKKLEDQEKIFIPFLNTETSINNHSTLINLNTASQTQLETLPGVGESTAKKIIENRPYKKVDDLLEVKGIGQSKYDSIKALIEI